LSAIYSNLQDRNYDDFRISVVTGSLPLTRIIKSRRVNPAMIQAMGVAEYSSKAAKCVTIHIILLCDLTPEIKVGVTQKRT